MMTSLMLLFFVLLLMGAILRYPAVSAAGAAFGLSAWFNSVLPALFPFAVLTGLLIRSGALGTAFLALKKAPLFRRFPAAPVFAAASGLLCGYPMGAHTVRELQDAGCLNERQARVLLAFVNQPGPMFLIGYALPLCGGVRAGRFLAAFYGGAALTGLTAALAETVRSRKTSPRAESGSVPMRTPETASPRHGFLPVFEESLTAAMVTMARIGGYMTLFSLISALAAELLPGQPMLSLLIGGCLEMTSGISRASALTGNTAPLFILGFASFGGLCVAAQSVPSGTSDRGAAIRYLLWKTVQTVCALILFRLRAGLPV